MQSVLKTSESGSMLQTYQFHSLVATFVESKMFCMFVFMSLPPFKWPLRQKVYSRRAVDAILFSSYPHPYPSNPNLINRIIPNGEHLPLFILDSEHKTKSGTI